MEEPPKKFCFSDVFLVREELIEELWPHFTWDEVSD